MIQVSGGGAESRVKGGFQYFHGIFSIWNSHFCVIPQGEIKILFEKLRNIFRNSKRMSAKERNVSLKESLESDSSLTFGERSKIVIGFRYERDPDQHQ